MTTEQQAEKLIKQLKRIADALEARNTYDRELRDVIRGRMTPDGDHDAIPAPPAPRPKPDDWDDVRASMPAFLRDELR